MEGGSVPGQSFRKVSKRRGDGNLALKNGSISTGIPGRAGNKRVFQVEGRARAMVQRWERADETGD